MQQQSFGLRDALLALIVVAVAGAARGGYVYTCMENLQNPPPFQVQDAQTAITMLRGDKAATTQTDFLVENLQEYSWFGGPAPFTEMGQQEVTAYDAPGYVSVISYAARRIGDKEIAAQAILWTQCAIGALTALFYMLFARLAFNSSLVGLFAGLLTAVHPFWIVNAAEFQDGTLASFLLASCLCFGAMTAKGGSPLAALLCGGALAGLALTRAALLPFTFVACLWVLLGCRKQPGGWLAAVLVVLGFLTGLAPWTVRNFQIYREVVPISDGMFVHLWMGNNAEARGGPQDEATLEKPLSADRLKALKDESDQVRRFRMLAVDVWESMRDDPHGTVEKRLRSGLAFVFGTAWFTDSLLSLDGQRGDVPEWVMDTIPIALRGFLLGMLVLGLIGWRWSGGSSLASLAMLWIPLPYLLSHAEYLSGPRLPLDGVLLTFAALVLASIIPGGAPGKTNHE